MNAVFEHATVLDCTGRDPQRDARVVVEDGRIRRIGAGSGPPGPKDAQVIDCQGRTLMPGLLDAHVHLALIDLDAAAEAALPPAVLALRIKDVIEATSTPASRPFAMPAGSTGDSRRRSASD